MSSTIATAFNYTILALFASAAVAWFEAGDFRQAIYWTGAFIVNATVAIK